MGIIIKDGIQYGRINPSGLDDTDHVVWASHTQNLTDAQKQIARDNIGAVAIQQGTANAGKALVVGADGNVTTGDAGIPEAVKASLLQLVRHVAYIDDQGQAYYDALYEALYNGGNTYPRLDVIYNPGIHTVYINDAVDTLRPYLIVKRRDNAQDSGTVVSDYTLSGSISQQDNIITITSSNLQYRLVVNAIDSKIMYELSAPLTLDGSTYVDTGVMLCDSNKDWSILIEAIDNHSSTFTTSEIPILLDSMDGDNSPYPGFAFGYNTSKNKKDNYSLFGLSNYNSDDIILGQRRTFKLAIRYLSDEIDFDIRCVLANGENLNFTYNSSKDELITLNKTLGIGGQTHTDGTMYEDRYWYGGVNTLKVFSRIISDNEVEEFFAQ